MAAWFSGDSCPVCQRPGIRTRRKVWMRIFPGSRSYHCPKCRISYLDLLFASIIIKKYKHRMSPEFPALRREFVENRDVVASFGGKSCPVCLDSGKRTHRKVWMRMLPGSRLYHCSTCGLDYLRLLFVRITMSKPRHGTFVHSPVQGTK